MEVFGEKKVRTTSHPGTRLNQTLLPLFAFSLLARVSHTPGLRVNSKARGMTSIDFNSAGFLARSPRESRSQPVVP